MSGYVPKRVSSTRTAMGTTDQRPLGSGSVMLGLVGGIGASNWSSRVNKRRAYASMLKKECVQGERSATSCKQTTLSFTDRTPPTVLLFSISDPVLIVGDTATIILVFSEAVLSFSSDTDITVYNGTLTSMTSSDNITWTGTFTPAINIEDTSNELTLLSSYTDTAGHTGPSATTVNYAVDTIIPVITVTSGTDTVSQGVTWVDAGATSDGGESVIPTGTVDTSIAGTYTVTNTATDAAGNVGTATRTVTVTA